MNLPPLIEWIPNISTGNPREIAELERLFQKLPDIYLLHTDIGPAVNRTVFTIAGTMGGLRNALFELLGWIGQKIDMGLHKGTHPRLGALDVSPYVMLRGGTREGTLLWIRELAKEVSDLFQFPIYLYEQSASHPDRINLAEIRRGEYEGLEKKLADPVWAPDFGGVFNARMGATVMGLRDFLIAYNVNLDTDDLAVAKSIAGQIRHKGNPHRRYALPGVKAIGWHLEGPGFCQVSTNITRSRDATPLDVYERCRILAEEMGCRVTGSELIGLIPHHSVLAMQNGRLTTTELARHLGLEYCGIGDLKSRIIEYKVYLVSGKSIYNEIFETS